MTIGTNTSPLVGKVKGAQGHRPHGQGPPRQGAGRQRLARASLPHRAPRRLGGAGPRRAGAGHPGRADAPRGLRADRRQAAGGHQGRSTARSTSRSSASRSTCPRSTSAPITQLLAARKGRMDDMANHGTGWVRMEFVVPARGLIGFRTEFLTETRGTGIAAPRSSTATSRGSVRSAHPQQRLARRRPLRRGHPVRHDQRCRSAGTLFVEPRRPRSTRA